MKKVGVRNLKGDKQEINRGLILKEEKIYMPKDEKLRAEIIQLHHNILVAGHEDRQKIMELIMRNYWWSGVTKDVGKYMESCYVCQRMKNRTEALAGKLMTNEILEKP